MELFTSIVWLLLCTITMIVMITLNVNAFIIFLLGVLYAHIDTWITNYFSE